MEQHEMQMKKKGAFRDFFEALLIALAIALPVKYFIASPFIVVGTSMVSTFEDKDYLIVDKLIYAIKEPERGDVIVFRPPYSDTTYFIKRVIGLPGETVHVDGNTVVITNKEHPEGFTLTEPYVSSMRGGITDMTLGNDEYFVLGDNRSVSSDSRVWGKLPGNRISGRVDLRLFPLNQIGVMPGKARSQ
jgi:signal peptidase I